MRTHPTAFAWVDPFVSPCSELDNARVRALARRLGYHLYWPAPSMLPLLDQVRAADVDAVIAPSTDHFDVMQLSALMCLTDVETAAPRMSFDRGSAYPRQAERI
ncbi:hypothetical protein BJY24_003071 [Nocardia transvalensis]|uniref:Uncharacterized protein n=1 Tax=Nocardia transvalensis TaxID=37333 RepID=A0A7W9PEJ6_9NOCA|nr:hypothetical protein [Nocardia transvalensis]MBB5914204.1 hypothetical protein [Nocardia transvalensis]